MDTIPTNLPPAKPGVGDTAETLDPTPQHEFPKSAVDPAFAETLAPGEGPPASGRLPEEVPGYELISELGRGGMGVVYHARQRALNRPVALKMILAGEYASPAACVRFLSEAEAIARLHHPNIVQIYELGSHRNVPYFSLEFMERGSLDKRLDGQPWPPAQAAHTIQVLAAAIQAAHDKGVVHRDLKPGNILIGADETLKITDFGLAKRVEGGGVTASGSLMGTPSYMAPEQARGEGQAVGPPADVYALGAILYELLTGRPPFRAATPLDTVLQVVTQEPVAPRALVPKVPRDLETICLKCLQKDPAQRYASAADLADDLRRFGAGEGIKARPVPWAERAQRWARKRPAAAALIAVSALSLIALFAGGVVHNRRLAAALDDAHKQRVEADRQREQADQQRVEADQQRQKAVASLDERLQMVDDLIFNFDTRLVNSGAPTGVRLDVLDDARKLNEKLLSESPQDPRLRRQAARIGLALGQVLVSYDAQRAQPHLDRAIDLERALADEQPGQSRPLAELMEAYERRGGLNSYRRRYPAALADFKQAGELADRLVTLAPQEAGHRDRAAAARLNMGRVQEAAGELAEALPLYRESAQLAEEAVKQEATPKSLGRQLAATTALAWALEKSAPDEARDWHLKAVAVARQVNTDKQRDESRALYETYIDASHFLRRRHDHAALAKLADDYARDMGAQGVQTYNAACLMCWAVEAAAKAPGPAGEERQKLVDGYAARALAMLQRSIEQGHTDLPHMAADSDLDSLRERQDYRDFMALQEKRFPAKVVTPAALVAKYKANYEGQYGQYEQGAGSMAFAERKRAERDRPDFFVFADRLLALAEKNSELPAAVDAVTAVLDNVPTDAPSSKLAKVRDRSLALLKKDHLGKPNIRDVCRVLSTSASPEGDGVLVAILEKNPAADLRGLAAYALALSQIRQAETARRSKPAEADRLGADAERQLERALKEYGAGNADRQMTAQVRKKLVELRTLSVGKPAREIAGEDLDGKPMKLSAYKGKVVLLDFWANWCGFCRQMYPGERAMVERLAGRPFAIVGVNRDESREAAQRAVKTQRLGWPSWHDDEGNICTAWQVDSFPQMYLIDHRGVIRKRWKGHTDQEEIDTAVNELLSEAEAEAGKTSSGSK